MVTSRHLVRRLPVTFLEELSQVQRVVLLIDDNLILRSKLVIILLHNIYLQLLVRNLAEVGLQGRHRAKVTLGTAQLPHLLNR